MLLLVILMSFASQSAQGTEPTKVECKLRTPSILIGEQVELQLTCLATAGASVQFPTWTPGDTLTNGVEIIKTGQLQSTATGHGQAKRWTQTYVLTAFDSMHVQLPPLPIVVNGKALTDSTSTWLTVHSVPVDTVHVNQFAGTKEVVELPFEWRYRLLIEASLALLMAALAMLLFMRLTNPRHLTRKVIIYPPKAPETCALEQTECLQRTMDDLPIKDFYQRLSDTLRDYVTARFRLNATTMTSSEIDRAMKNNLSTDDHALLKKVLTEADLVKFAKRQVYPTEQRENLTDVVTFVNHTRPAVTTVERPRIRYVGLTDKKQRLIKVIMRVVAIGLTLTAIGLTAAISYDAFTCFA